MVELAVALGGALVEAHGAEVLHGEVHPSNVFFDEDGRVYLGGFGIASVLASVAGPLVDSEGLVRVIAGALCGRVLDIDADCPDAVRSVRPDVAAEVLAVIAHGAFDVPAVLVAKFSEAVTTDARGVPVRNPFKGLRPFLESDSTDFFGRNRLVAEVLAALRLHRLVTIVGPSGSGKSSLARAGVARAVRAGAIPGSAQWSVCTIVPGSSPWEQLDTAPQQVARTPLRSALDQLRFGPDAFIRSIRKALPDGRGQLLLIIDQFEELWTHVSDAHRTQLIESLVAAIVDPTSSLRVLTTLRADFVDRVARLTSGNP